ncbi:MAG TPA: gamma carbonic anhydrase family protein [Mycobacteriales bacterium]
MPVYSLGDLRPEIDPTAFVHPDAVIIGSVRLHADVSVWPGAVLRGDYGSIVVGERTSVQDGSILHATEEHPTIIGSDCVVGHAVHLEGCRISDRCLIGSNSTVLHLVTIESEVVVAAGAVVTPGTHVPSNALMAGVPARVVARDRSFDQFRDIVTEYVGNARRYEESLRLLT